MAPNAISDLNLQDAAIPGHSMVRRLRLLRHSRRCPLRSLGLQLRQTAKGTYGLHPFGMAEAVDVHTALRSYTAWGAPRCF